MPFFGTVYVSIKEGSFSSISLKILLLIQHIMTTPKALLVLLATLVCATSMVMASPTPEEHLKEIGCIVYPATTRTPFCTPQ